LRPADPNETQVYLPDFCAAGTLFIILLVAELVAIVLTLAAHSPEGQFLLSLSKTSFFVLWLALLGTAVLCKLRGWLERAGKTRAFVFAFLLLVALSLVIAELAWQLPVRLVGVNVINDSHGDFLLRTLAISAIFIALAMRYLYVSS
jgi:two-component system sensor histidine kinase AlgZ